MLFAQLTDTSALLEIGKQVPSLVVLCVLTWLFLKQSAEARTEYLGSIKMVHDENVEARTISQAVIKDNTIATLAMTATFHQLIKTVEHLQPKKK